MARRSRLLHVLIVEESVAARLSTRQLVIDTGHSELCSGVSTGRAALDYVTSNPVDLVILDQHLPDINSTETLQRLLAIKPELRVIIKSDSKNPEAAMHAMRAGAVEFLVKPSNREEREDVTGQLTNLIAELRAELDEPRPVPDARPRGQAAEKGLRERFSTMVIGSSTGGCQALEHLVPLLPQRLPFPVFIVQHLPAGFTRSFAADLQKRTRLVVTESQDGARVQNGAVTIAAGGFHTEVIVDKQNKLALRLTAGERVNGCRPSVDVLMRSLQQLHSGPVVSIILTGMGNDGCAGVGALRQSGGMCIVQDQASSVVYGMGRCVVEAGYADRVMGLTEIGSWLATAL